MNLLCLCGRSDIYPKIWLSTKKSFRKKKLLGKKKKNNERHAEELKR